MLWQKRAEAELVRHDETEVVAVDLAVAVKVPTFEERDGLLRISKVRAVTSVRPCGAAGARTTAAWAQPMGVGRVGGIRIGWVG